ncbi:hypothetical protein SAMN05216480_101865 [Pustulibacterium marinum]|uniref:Uncharacterized protein n=1 Tax=Pustulibacterium marinum TaxID=1224947 RepID=A0A1I7FD46_9FLAO|nr:hypothetical protein SAMN05216480_101865 [Pustulibacterium marinum]
MFSTGQWIFAAAFVIVFITIITISYSRDKKLHKKNYNGVVWVLVAFLLFILTIILIKHYIIN